jgi:hypothetical protein
MSIALRRGFCVISTMKVVRICPNFLQMCFPFSDHIYYFSLSRYRLKTCDVIMPTDNIFQYFYNAFKIFQGLENRPQNFPLTGHTQIQQRQIIGISRMHSYVCHTIAKFDHI